MRGVDAMALLNDQQRIALIDAGRLERKAERIARQTVRRKSGRFTVAEAKRRAQNLLERCLEPVDDSNGAAARAREELWERRPKLRRHLYQDLGLGGLYPKAAMAFLAGW